jgi:hypothetical protein
MFVNPDGGVAQLGATVTAVTTPTSPTLSSAHLAARFMPPPDLGDLTLILGIFMAALPLPVKSVVMHVEVETSQIAISQRP